MHTVIFAGGTVKSGKAVYEAIAAAALIIAADSGAATALRFGCNPSILVGDFDSLDAVTFQELEERGVEIQRVSVEKDETDTALAIQVALERGATSITLLGALGGTRFDHAAANLLLLLTVEAVPFSIVDGPSVCWLLRGPGHATVMGHKGDLLTLLPITGDVTGVYTNNLYYSLENDILHLGKTRGTSNVLTQEKAEVSLERGILLLIHINAQELG